MAKTVSQFLLGIDLSYVAIVNDDCSSAFKNMTRLQWLKLTSTGIESIPKGVEQLVQLERLTISKNKITNISGNWWVNLKCLRFFDARKNLITDENIPEDFFKNPQLQVVDLSYNLLTEIPKGMLEAKSLLVLNLSNNQITSIPKELFANCPSLMMLDLSNNQLAGFPTNLRRMPNLQTLNLNNNNLTMAQLRSINGLKKLTSLCLSNTSRKLDNFPSDLDKLSCLSELDISDNNLKKVPQTVYEIRSLTKLNLSGNGIDELSGMVDCWPELGILNLSRNKLSALPSFITRLSKLKKLYVDDNQLTFNGIPPGIGKLSLLEVFSASENLLENIPEGLCRCGQLKQLNLRSNNLVTLPDAIHVLTESLTVFNVEYNPDLKMPPKFDDLDMKDKYKYYNIDFSLETQMQLARGSPIKPPALNVTQKDSASRIRRLRRKKYEDSLSEEKNSDSKCVLEGMKKVAKEKDALLEEREKGDNELVASKRWQDAIAKPNLDYSRLFDDDVGTLAGIEIWEIDEFYPRKIQEELMFGNFYNGDCYIILNTSVDDKTGTQLHWSIYYWIGNCATLDKVTCAAVHAVNLRNHLGAECRCEREEQDDESDEFKILFNGHIDVIEGAHGESGFLRSDERQHRKKLYRLFGGDKSISLFSCDTNPAMLDSKYVYFFDESFLKMYLWIGKKSRLMLQSKGRLVVDKINQRERKGVSEIIVEYDGEESDGFKSSLGESCETPCFDWSAFSRDHIPLDWMPPSPILYDVKLGKGFIEMPQVDFLMGRLTKTLLQAKRVYILESNGEIYVWVGDFTPKFLKFAGLKLAYEMVELLPRPSRRSPIICFQSVEPYVFKMQFCDWEDTVAVDFTRSAESVRKRGVDINEIMEKDKIKIDMRSFFMPREKPTPWDEAISLMEELNDDIFINDIDTSITNQFHIKQFVYQNKKWLPVEDRWVGHFFCEDSYIIHVEYWEFPDDDENGNDKNEDNDDTEENRVKTVIYFWQGREASDIPWLQFNFSMKKEMEIRFSGMHDKTLAKDELRKVEFQKMFQQQEVTQFLAHFQHRFVIHLGKYKDRYLDQRKNRVEMFYLRENGNAVCTRTIEVKPHIQFLNSCFHYILKVPARLTNSDKDQVICWIGKHSDSHYENLITTIANDTFNQEDAIIHVVKEGEEPDMFWTALGDKGRYDDEATFMNFTRLFRLSNEQGFFCASEKCTDFCQDDLADEDVMLLDTGNQIYLWFGNRTSDVEKKLSLQAAKLYKEHMNRLQPDRNRQLKITQKKKEPQLFRRCFHGWGPFKEAKEWSG